MSAAWIPGCLLVPLVGAGLACAPVLPRSILRILLAAFALPAVAVALLVPTGTELALPVLLVGSRLVLSEPARTFLLFTSGLWAIAGVYAAFYHAGDARLRGYTIFFLATFAGNLGLLLAADIPLFYASFALMTFAAYGLIVHTRTPEAVRAGGLYIGMAVLGEMMILAGLVWLTFDEGSTLLAGAPAAVAASPNRVAISALLLAGFGVKAGLFPLHVWLPLAHPVAPTPASAVLSGSMIKAGLYAWLVFLPGGILSLPGIGTTLIVLGLTAALAGALAALTQTRPKANLAYSSISQMGLMTLGVGIGLADSAAWPAAVGIVSFYAFSHAFAKGSLFMAVGAAHAVRSRFGAGLVVAGTGIGALVIAGAPLTGGGAAKDALKKLAGAAPGAWPGHLETLLAASTAATTLLLARLVQLVVRELRGHHGEGPGPRAVAILGVWVLSVVACAGLPWLLLYVGEGPVSATLPTGDAWLKAWPIGAGLAAAAVVLPFIDRLPGIPTGDLGLVLMRTSSGLARIWAGSIAPRMERSELTADWILRRLVPDAPTRDGTPERMDRRLRHRSGSGLVLLALTLVLWWSIFR